MNRLRSNPLPVVQLREALSSGLGALPDAELLDRFARYADHVAFEVLLRRHGPMVFGVCRRTLSSAADADDAFQATFLVFLRKAKQIRGERLGPWLYGVAWRVAQKARVRAARLAAYRTEGIEMLPAADENAPVPDWLPVLDAELSALPTKYREALVLCELQGRSRAEAARELGLREGTLSSRLARGRDLLRKRLLKHGTLLPAGGLAALFGASGVGRATAPGALLAKVSELAKGAGAGAVPVGAARLTDEVLRSMLLMKLRTAGGALTLLLLTTVGVAAAVWPAEVPAPGLEAQMPAPRPVDKRLLGTPQGDRDALQGLWVLEKVEANQAFHPGVTRHLKEKVSKIRILIAGDVWWNFESEKVDSAPAVNPHVVKLDAGKNPKWIDFAPYSLAARPQTSSQGIYELDGDRLRLYGTGGGPRPAEFSLEGNVPLMMMEYRRDKMPPAAGDKALVGTWVMHPDMGVVAQFGNERLMVQTQAFISDSFMFLKVPSPGSQDGVWAGGRYTLDTSKNPKWFDLELVNGYPNRETTKLYGSYETRSGGLQIALGLTGNRAVRPLSLHTHRLEESKTWLYLPFVSTEEWAKATQKR